MVRSSFFPYSLSKTKLAFLLSFFLWGKYDLLSAMPGNSAVEWLQQKTSELGKKHPEFLKNPSNTPCSGCLEDIDRRTADQRFYIDQDDIHHFYIQKSFTPLHFKRSADGPWLSLDYRIREEAVGVYAARQQPVEVITDMNTARTEFKIGEGSFLFNRRQAIYFSGAGRRGDSLQLNLSDYKQENGGLLVRNIFPGADLNYAYDLAEVKTSWTIKQMPVIPQWAEYMVITDQIMIPQGMHLRKGPAGLGVTDSLGREWFHYRYPSFFDQRFYGIRGEYRLLEINQREAEVQMMIPVQWLKDSSNVFPLVIDPIVRGSDSLGYYWYVTNPQTPYGPIRFTSEALGTCDYQMTVTVPGMSRLVRAFTELEYKLSFDATCGNPPIPAPFCTFSQVRQTILSPCNRPISLACNPALPPYTGTCTSDPTKVPGASPILIYDLQSSNPVFRDFLQCVPPQCPDYQLDFTLKNSDSICGDVCGDKCAWGNVWIMTIEGRTIEAFITADKDRVCAGQPVTLTVHPSWGVPPYRYRWSNGMTDSIITIYPNQSLFIGATAFDTCGNSAIANDTLITVIQTPPADAGPPSSLCEGGTVDIGGTPTTDPGATISWNAMPPAQNTWLSSTAASNPLVSVPAASVDTFKYILRTAKAVCFRLDSSLIISRPNPIAIIDTTQLPKVCEGQAVILSAPSGFTSYFWNTGAVDSVTEVAAAGNYFVVVTDSFGCKDSSNVVELFQIPLPSVQVFPDTTIRFGDTISLRTDLQLSLETDSFRWRIQDGISCSDCPQPLVWPEKDAWYLIEVYKEGCKAVDSALVRVILPNNFFVPNAFTPNGDGQNDDFYIQTQSGVTVVVFRVFDRWGEKVHEGSFPWAGTFRGSPAPMGVYVYEFVLKLFNNERVPLKGSVTLIR